MLDCDHQSFPAGTLRQIFRHERLRRVPDEGCADIIILPRGKCDWMSVNDFARDDEPNTGGN